MYKRQTPHGIHVDDEGNVWVADFAGNEAGTKGHQVHKFSPDGELLMSLGTAGQPGDGPNHLNQPNDESLVLMETSMWQTGIVVRTC